jgi:hypothetical protein
MRRIDRRIPAVLFALACASARATPIADVNVNEWYTDFSANDTQSTAALVRIDANTILCAFNDSGSYNGGTTNHFTGWAVSSDGGATFADRGLFPNSTDGDVGNPVAARDAVTGRIYIATLAFGTTTRIPLFRSTDNGATLSAPVTAMSVGMGGPLDRQWLAVDNFAGTGQGNVYLLARDYAGGGGMRFARSIDGSGSTWLGPILLTNVAGQGAHLAVGADHAVYAFFLDTGNVLRVRRSTNLGFSFDAATTIGTLGSTAVNGDLGMEFRTSGFVRVAADPQHANRLFAVYADKGAGVDRGNIVLRQSDDFGATWSGPTRVDTDAGTNDQFTPTIAITPDGSRLFVGWYDRRRDPANALIEYWGRIATLAGATPAFGPDFPISSGSFPAAVGQDPNLVATYLVDYDQATADDAYFYAAWADTRLSSVAHAHQPDVRFAKLPVAGDFILLFRDGFE